MLTYDTWKILIYIFVLQSINVLIHEFMNAVIMKAHLVFAMNEHPRIIVIKQHQPSFKTNLIKCMWNSSKCQAT